MKKILSLVIAFAIYMSINSQSIQFMNIYGGLTRHDFGLSVDYTSDGGYVLLGHSILPSSDHQALYLIKLDSVGNVQWQQHYGDTADFYGQSVLQTTDGGYVLCGFFDNSQFGQGTDIIVFKVNASGQAEWRKHFGGSLNDWGYNIKQTADGGFIVCGSSRSYGGGEINAILIKINAAGNQEWMNTFGGSQNDGSYSVDITQDGGYILCGYTYSYSSSLDDVMLIKTDTQGNQEWMQVIGGQGNDRGLSVKTNTTGGYFIAGYTNSFGAGGDNMYFIKTNANGEVETYKTYGGNMTDRAYSIDVNQHNEVFIAGTTNSYGMGGNDFYVVKTDTLGNLIWQNTFGYNNHDEGFSVVATPDRGAAILGKTIAANQCSNILLVKADSAGNASGAFIYEQKNISISLYPNPAYENVFIGLPENTHNSEIMIVNLLGQIVFQEQVNGSILSINVSGYNDGMYFVRIRSDLFNHSNSFVKTTSSFK